jgi:hypothetical protein
MLKSWQDASRAAKKPRGIITHKPMHDISKLLTALPHLSPAELRTVHERCAALLTIGPKGDSSSEGAPGAAGFAMDLYGAFSDALLEITKVKSMPFPVFTRTAAGKWFRDAAAVAQQANDVWFPKQSRAERLSMAKLYASLVLDHLAARERPAVWQNISAAVSSLPVLVDYAFPGYAAIGMLGKVQNLRTRPRHHGE